MVVHYPRERLRYNSERPTAICDVLLATGPRSYRSGDISLGTPTTSARTRRGLWALYPIGEEVVVAHPDGAIAGPSAEVAATLDRLAGADGHEPLERQVVQALCRFLVSDQTEVRPTGRRSRPAIGYWLSEPRDEPGRNDRRARLEPTRRPPAVPGDGRIRPTRPEATPESGLRPAA
jgi:hypothetical protein